MKPERMCAVCGTKPAASKVGGAVRCLDCRPDPNRTVMCDRCLERPAVRKQGQHRCGICRLLCARCEKPKVANSAYCTAHRSEIGKQRPRILKTCLDCGIEFRTKAAANYCGSCKHQRMKHPCADCGTPVDKRATRCRKCAGIASRGSGAYNWNGGRSTMKVHGYVLVKTPPGHPRSAQPYIREHVLVMEAMLGRFLLPGENVHHRNGQRADNRPENLELWVKSQPAGQRVDDLLTWAREIITRYG